MTKKKINITDYAGQILSALKSGILLTTKAEEKVNSMVIGWGTLGINWATPVFVAYIREGRFTASQLAKNPEFTVNIPIGSYDRKIIGICGGKSGRNIDKVKEAGLTLVEPNIVSVPAIKEFPLTLECKVMYSQKQNISALSEKLQQTMYPQNIGSEAVGANKDAHITYFGEIVDAYIIEA